MQGVLGVRFGYQVLKGTSKYSRATAELLKNQDTPETEALKIGVVSGALKRPIAPGPFDFQGTSIYFQASNNKQGYVSKHLFESQTHWAQRALVEAKKAIGIPPTQQDKGSWLGDPLGTILHLH